MYNINIRWSNYTNIQLSTKCDVYNYTVYIANTQLTQ